MNNNGVTLLRSLIPCAICVPAAMLIGDLLVQRGPIPSVSSFAIAGLVTTAAPRLQPAFQR